MSRGADRFTDDGSQLRLRARSSRCGGAGTGMPAVVNGPSARLIRMWGRRPAIGLAALVVVGCSDSLLAARTDCTPTLIEATAPARRLEAPQWQARAERFLARGELECALEAFREALDLQPDSLEIRRGLATVYLSQHRYRAAIAELQRTLELKPDDIDSMLMLGRAFSENKSDASAIEVLRRLVGHAPDHFVGRFNLATAFAQAERYAEAAREFEHALDLAPSNHGARLAAAKCEVNIGNHRRALELVDDWDESVPDGVDGFEVEYLRGIALRGISSFVRAEDVLRKAVGLKPEHAGARRELGTVLARQGRLEEASRQLRRARELDPESQETWLELVVVLRETGDEQALTAETALFEKRKEEIRLEELARRAAARGSKHLERGDASSALREYRQALAYRPQSAEHHYGAALAHARLGEQQERISALEQALELDPGSSAVLNELGVAYTEASRFPEAEAVLSATLESNPQLASASNNLGVLLAKQGRHVEAEVMFRRAVEDDPQYVHAHVNLGIALASMGRLEDALAAIQVAAGIDPSSQLVDRAREMIREALQAR